METLAPKHPEPEPRRRHPSALAAKLSMRRAQPGSRAAVRGRHSEPLTLASTTLPCTREADGLHIAHLEHAPLNKRAHAQQVMSIWKGVSVYDQERWAKTEFTYRDSGHVATVKYPDFERVDYSYTRDGLVSQVRSASGRVYAQGLTYDIFGRSRTIAHGNGVTDARVYSSLPSQMYRLQSLTITKSSQTHLSLGYASYTPLSAR